MSRYLHGDVPKEYLLLEEELIEMEEFFDNRTDKHDPAILARGYVCIAFDYYGMDCEEKGSELLEKAEKVYPGYFNRQIFVDMEKDSDYDVLVKGLTGYILGIVKSYAKGKR
jgi:hypothetical protein